MDEKTIATIEQKLAIIYFDMRDNGVSYTKIIIKLWGVRFILRLLLLAVSLLLYVITDNPYLLSITCFFFGASIEGLSYYYKTLRIWPITSKLLNWDKLEEIANNSD